MQCQEIKIADLTPLSKMEQVLVQNILLIFYLQNSPLTKRVLRQSIFLGQQECRCGIEYQHSNSGGVDYIVGGAEVDIVSQNS